MKLRSLVLGIFAGFLTIIAFAQEVNTSQLYWRNQRFYVDGAKTVQPYTGDAVAYYKNGKMSEKKQYLNGKLNGTYLSWYDTGNKQQEVDYLQGALSGQYNTWYPNGNKMMSMTFKFGEKNGPCEIWYKDGKPWMKTNFKNDLMNGIFEIFNKDGKTNFKVDIYGYHIKTIYSASGKPMTPTNYSLYMTTIQRWHNKIVSLQSNVARAAR
ncbi:MAG: toxin-antitoxin system YwqK family antitoxin [bacterium]|nr:toxin-antitoxin system YwqK family antitoxin [bacterium]